MSARAVLFDMDGTLVDSEPTHHKALLDVLTEHDVTLPSGFGEAVTGLSMRAVYDLLVATTKIGLSYDSLVAAKYDAYIRRRSELALRPGAREVLALVENAGLKFAIVSNSDRMLVSTNMASVGLTRPDMITVTRNDVRRGKPHPEPYLRAAWLLDVEPADCVVVEDSVAGAEAGHAAGMTVIGWPEPHRTDFVFPAGTLVADPSDLIPTLQSLLRPAAA